MYTTSFRKIDSTIVRTDGLMIIIKQDLLMHDYKPWDSDAKEFYENLVKANKRVDAQQDQDDYY